MRIGKKIIQKAYSGAIKDIDTLASEVLIDCKSAAKSVIETISKEINLQIRKDKSMRKELGLVLKEKDRPEEIITELSRLNIPRAYYRDKENGRYISLLDHIIGIRAYERIGSAMSAELVSLVTEVSYAKSAQIVSDSQISRQTVKNHIRKLSPLEKQPKIKNKREVKQLHIYADENHVHMQRPKKSKGKSNKIVLLVTVTEGINTENRKRHRTIKAMHFVGENFDTKNYGKALKDIFIKHIILKKLRRFSYMVTEEDGSKMVSIFFRRQYM